MMDLNNLLDELLNMTKDRIARADALKNEARALIPKIQELEERERPFRFVAHYFHEDLQSFLYPGEDRRRQYENYGVAISNDDTTRLIKSMGHDTSQGFVIDPEVKEIASRVYSELIGRWTYEDFGKKCEEAGKHLFEQLARIDAEKVSIQRRSLELSEKRDEILMGLAKFKWHIEQILKNIPSMQHGYDGS